MGLATRANLRVAAAARKGGGGREKAMQIAFRTGGVVGFLTVGLGLFGAALVVLIYQGDAPTVLEGFGFGAALLAMFMRVGGGIFTKAADVGADLVGKVEQGIPEDDPRNAATIADNVGDNVGDCAGMAADLFESYAVTLVAALILGRAAWGIDGLVFPLIIGGIGVLVAIVGVFITRLRPSDRSGMTAINRAFYISAVISAVLVAIVSFALPAGDASPGSAPEFAATVGQPALDRDRRGGHRHRAGRDHPGADRLLHRDRPPSGPGHRQGVRDRRGDRRCWPASASASSRPSTPRWSSRPASSARTSSAARSPCSRWRWPARGLLTTVGVIVAMDTFGPISDNAQGIAEMSGDIDKDGARTLTDLDAVGNTTKAITKGIAIATAVLAATALFGSYTDTVTDRAAGGRVDHLGSTRCLQRVRAEEPGRPAHRRGGRVPLLRAGDQRGVPLGHGGRVRGAAPVPGAARDHGRHPAPGVRQGRRHLHPGRPA